jgi:hypothetical protein
MRRKEEFYCSKEGGGCGCYFLTYLRTDMTGDYTIECAKCHHQHFRAIKDGLVTKDRHSHRDGSKEIIVGLLCTVRDTPWHNDPDFRRSQLFAYAGGAG